VGLSTRSNLEAVHQMDRHLGRYGYRLHGVQTQNCLHLKTAVTRVDDTTLLINRKWVELENFEGFDLIDVDASEPLAANCLPLGGSIIFPAAFPNTAAKLAARGYKIRPVFVDELAKAEGAVTCCSLILEY
jgi:dimethylargininase